MSGISGEFKKDDSGRKSIPARIRALHGRIVEPELEDLPMGRRIPTALYRFWILLIDNITRTELSRRAAALTYTTILSLFPLLAIISFTATFFYTSEKESEYMGWIQQRILPSMETEQVSFPMTKTEMELVAQQQKFADTVGSIFTTVSTKFRNSAAGAGIFGFIGLLITCGLLFHSIEQTVNLTWRATDGWRWQQTLTNFMFVIVFAPMIIALTVTGSGIAMMLLDKDLDAPVEKIAQMAVAAAEDQPDSEPQVEVADSPTTITSSADTPSPSVSPLIRKVRSVTTAFGFIIPVIPLLINAIVLAIAYSFLPRARVSVPAALVGGLVASALWEGARTVFFSYIYLSMVNRTLTDVLGVTVVFLIWIYMTWMILLLGNLIVYAVQNFASLWAERRTGDQTMMDSRLLVAVMTLLGAKFDSTGGGLTELDIRTRLGVARDSFARIVRRLRDRGMVSVTETGEYQISRSPENIRLRDLISLGTDLDALPISRRAPGRISAMLHEFQEHTLEAAADATLGDLIHGNWPARNKAE